MSDNNSNFKPTYPKLQKTELKGSAKVIIPDDIADKIRFLCKKISKLEWSGILFYTMEGTMSDCSIDKITITLKDILLMDIGTKSYTGFDWGEDLVNYQMDHPESISWIKGHIHSHNDMPVFFSETDNSELNDNTPSHNIYLSVIVNNYMEVKGKLAFTASPTSFICKDETGKDYKLSVANMTPYLMVYDCEFEHKMEQVIVPEEFASRLDSVTKKVEEENKKKPTYYPSNGSSNVRTPGYYGGEKFQQGELGMGLQDDWTTEFPLPTKTNDTKGSFDYEEDPSDGEELAIFSITKMLDEKYSKNLSLGKLLYSLEKIEMSESAIALQFENNYSDWYNSFFKFSSDSRYATPEVFLQILDDVIQAFDEEVDFYPFIAVSIGVLKEIGNKFEAAVATGQIK